MELNTIKLLEAPKAPGSLNGFFKATPKSIQNFRQNHPEYVVRDCEQFGFTPFQLGVLRQSLKVRGINKWLKVRRDLIAYKKILKHRIRALQVTIPHAKEMMTANFVSVNQVRENPEKYFDKYLDYRELRENYFKLKTELQVLEHERFVLRSLCKTHRWQEWEGKKLSDMNTLRASDERIIRDYF